ncbi:MAG TPA: Maf family nucleotide pyrophosphatase [Chitinophagaceae bacterium]|nr:Maf family nucleotide pyrophosphatase [Chitinophagaceae bacterium]
MVQKIILASQSPRRKQLLEWAEIPFEVIVPPTDESFPEEMPVEEVPVYIAQHKAEAVKQSLSNTKKQLPILAADTIVVLNEKIIGKPKNRNEAISILMSLSGNKHKVITGVVILSNDKIVSFADTTDVTFHQLAKKEIEFYVDKYKPYDKAGAYAIQEWIGVIGIKSVNGDFYNVMGLPVSRVVKELNKLNY